MWQGRPGLSTPALRVWGGFVTWVRRPEGLSGYDFLDARSGEFAAAGCPRRRGGGASRDLPRRRERAAAAAEPERGALLLVRPAAGAREAGRRLGQESIAGYLTFAADLVALFLVINLAALTIFDLVLRRLRLGFPDILHDLTVGAAYAVALIWSMHRWGVRPHEHRGDERGGHGRDRSVAPVDARQRDRRARAAGR